MTGPRLVTPERRADDIGDTSLRPQNLSEFVGQSFVLRELRLMLRPAPLKKLDLSEGVLGELQPQSLA